MKTPALLGLTALLTVALAGGTVAQDPGLELPRNVRIGYALGTRSEDGNPGPAYWQNHAVHDISITFTPPDRTVHGSEDITYTNDSPFPLDKLVVRLYQNSHRPTAMRETVYTEDFLTSGITIDEFAIDGVVTPWEPLELPFETVKIIVPSEPLGPGESLDLSFKWHFDLPLEAQKDGVVGPGTYFISYFFPRVSVFSDTDVSIIGLGWDIEEYTYRAGRELNNDFADFTFDITLPKDYIVWATGELQNPDEVLQPEYAQRLKESLTSDEVINIARPDQIAAGDVTAQADEVTWRWKADGVPDIAIGISDRYVWDAGSVVVDPGSGRRVGIDGAYPESATQFADIVDEMKDMILFGSQEYPGVPWPYPRETVFAGGADEEFPMMANDGLEGPLGASVRFVAAHELLHTFFPFVMGTDERRYPILDEGWTTAFEYLFDVQDIGQDVADGLFKTLRTSSLAQPTSGVDMPAILPADSLRGAVASDNAYGKASMAYLAARDLLGDDMFKQGLQEFIARWAGKHPLPWDMFNTFNDVSGQDLDWFWRDWFHESNYTDLAVGEVRPAADGYEIEVVNSGGFAVPFDVNVQYADGTSETSHQTPAVWQTGDGRAVIGLEAGSEPTTVTVDTGIYVDATPADNAWPMEPPA